MSQDHFFIFTDDSSVLTTVFAFTKSGRLHISVKRAKNGWMWHNAFLLKAFFAVENAKDKNVQQGKTKLCIKKDT